jgi:hypothetical protein
MPPQTVRAIIMSLFSLSLEHGRSRDDARNRLEVAVDQIRQILGPMIKRVAWSADRSQVRIDGAGFWLEFVVDARRVHATGDVAMLGQLLGGPLTAGVKRIMQQTLQKQLQ